MILHKLPTIIACLLGLVGVGLLAAAAHINNASSVQIAGQFLLFHAPVLLALGALRGQAMLMARLSTIAIWLLILGLVLFCGDLALRGLQARSLFSAAAPLGGGLILLGWAMAAISAFKRQN